MEKLEVDFSDLKEVIENLIKKADEGKDEKDYWAFNLIITRESNGYVIDGVSDIGSKPSSRVRTVIEDDEEDELKSGESLLWAVMEYFGFGGSRHDKIRIKITREKGDKYSG